MNIALTHQRQRLLYYWLPAIIAGGIACFVFILIGNTPFVRSAGLAVAIMGVTLTLRRLGALLAMTGGLALAFSPAFWSQTGGMAGSMPDTVALLLGGAALIAILIVAVSQRPYVVMVVAISALAVLFFGQLGIARSLRLTVIASAWLIYLLVNAVMETNPRPDGPPPARLKARYRAGLLLLLAVGIINDPLFVLFVPAVVLGLFFSKSRIPYWYWALVVIMTGVGLRGITVEYINPVWWDYPALALDSLGTNVPYLVADGWREPKRWVDIFVTLARQFSLIGVFLGVMGLARLARWYPVLGIVMMVAWGMFFGFGLAYFGRDSDILLLPLFMIQIICITYAVYVIGQWIEQSARSRITSPQNFAIVRLAVPLIYVSLPLILILQIIDS